MADIFVSYSQKDRPLIEALVAEIEGAGFTVWYDTRLRPGQSFDDVIAAELDAAGTVLVVWSRDSVKSVWVKDEAQVGADRGALVPVSLDGTMPPLGFRQFQSLNIAGWQGGESRALTRMLNELRLRAGREIVGIEPAKPAVLPGVKSPRGRVWLGLTAMAAVLIAVAGFAMFGGGRPVETPVATDDPVGDPAAVLTGAKCSLLRAETRADGVEIEGEFGPSLDVPEVIAAVTAAGGREAVMAGVSIPDLFCPLLDALRPKAIARWDAPRASMGTLYGEAGTQRSVEISIPAGALDPARVVYAVDIRPFEVATLLIATGGKLERQTAGDLPAPQPLPAHGALEAEIPAPAAAAPHLVLFLELAERWGPLEDALDAAQESDPARFAAALAADDAPAVLKARLVVLDRGWNDPPDFTAERDPAAKVEGLYRWLLANRPARRDEGALPHPATYADAAFAPQAVEAFNAVYLEGDGPVMPEDVLFPDLLAAGAPAAEGLALAQVRLQSNDGSRAVVRASVTARLNGAAVTRLVDLTLTRADGVWLIADAAWPDRAQGGAIPAGATLRQIIERFEPDNAQ